MRGNQRVNCVLCFTRGCVRVLHCKHAALYCSAMLCRAIQSSILELTGERSVLFTYRPLPHQL
ncbi:unnamed protein product [Staurois parvus]|uniref:Uncharacterized protein n=1 Tax=Staurois parvus TaxID=386267 RepID=A0ABN9BKE6_9NEOB|nr:unnamed protein product [Staurois parvus]